MGCFALAIPSAVSIFAPSHSHARVMQDRTGLPFIITVQEPQAPCPPHQSLGEVRPISSRSSCRRLQFGSTVTLYFPPFTVNSMLVGTADTCSVPPGGVSESSAPLVSAVIIAADPTAGTPTISPASFRKVLRDTYPDFCFFPTLDFFSSFDIFARPAFSLCRFSPPGIRAKLPLILYFKST